MRHPPRPLLFGPLLCAGLASFASAQQTIIQRIPGYVDNEEFGASVAGGRDIDNDGVPDVVVGSPRSDIAGFDRGTVRVISGADGSVLHTWHGLENSAGLGIGVTTLPDLDGDGHDEVVTGSWYQPVPSKAGIVTVRSGIDGSILHQWTSGAGTFFGEVVEDLGDIDGDGFHDLAVGAQLTSNLASYGGAVHVYSGLSGNLIRSHDGSIGNARFGASIAGGHDFTGDGVPDYVVGSPYTQGGRFDLFSGSDGAFVNSLTETSGFGQLGRLVALSADIDGDGLAEVFAASPNGGPPARVYSGADLSLLHIFSGSGIGNLFGWSIAAPGDTNFDGVPDFVVGAYGWAGATGLIEVYSGADGTALHRLYGWKGGSYFGKNIEAAGDLDGDGSGDLIVGCNPFYADGGGPGAVRVVSASCLGEAQTYGNGLMGSGGFVPSLDPIGCPALTADFGIRIDQALGGARGQLLLGFGPLSAAAFGGTILVAPPWILVPFNLGGAGAGAGSRELITRLADDPTLVGVEFYLQALIWDAGAPVGVSMTNGMHITIR